MTPIIDFDNSVDRKSSISCLWLTKKKNMMKELMNDIKNEVMVPAKVADYPMLIYTRVIGVSGSRFSNKVTT